MNHEMAIAYFSRHQWGALDCTYNKAAKYLIAAGWDARCFRHAPNYYQWVNVQAQTKPVLAISHRTMNMEPLFEVVRPINVYYYGGQSLNKFVIQSYLHKLGYPLPLFMYLPTSAESLFDALGDQVVAKPNSYGSCKSFNLQLYKRGDEIPALRRWLYQQYVGTSKPPYWCGRVLAMFGEVVSAFEQTGCHTSPFSGKNPDVERSVCQPWRDEWCLAQSASISKEMANHFGCGLVAVDWVRDDSGKHYITEVNTSKHSLAWEVPGDFDRGLQIKIATIRKVRELLHAS